MDYPTFCITDADKAAFDVAVKGKYSQYVTGVHDIRAIQRGCYVDRAAGNRAVEFIETFCYLAPGKRFILWEWQREKVVFPLFAWKRKDGARRFQSAWVELPKKNSKSTLCSAIALYMMLADGEYKSQVYCAAWSRGQAKIVFDESVNMVKNNPGLLKHLGIYRNNRMTFDAAASYIQALSKDAEVSEGLNASCVIIDEIHAHRNRKLHDALLYAGAARKQPLFIVITTAGESTAHFAYDLHRQAQMILSGEWNDDSRFVFIAAASPDDDWMSEETWKKANPAYGMSLDMERFKKDFEQAKKFKSSEMSFKRYRLNIWQSGNDKSWMKIDAWDRLVRWSNREQFEKRECYGGLDVSSTSDLTSLVLLFPEQNGCYSLLPFIWVPEDTAFERERRGEAPYHSWMQAGYIIGTPGDVIDYQLIRSQIRELAEMFGIRGIALDRNWQGQGICNDLIEDGINVVSFGQGFQSMSPASKQFEALIKKRKILVGGGVDENPVVRWCFGNCTIEQDAAGNIKPNKARSSDKIDPIVSTVMAVAIAGMADSTKSVYDSGESIYADDEDDEEEPDDQDEDEDDEEE